MQLIVHGHHGMSGGNAPILVEEEPKNAPGVLFNRLCLGVCHVLKLLVKQMNATLNHARVRTKLTFAFWILDNCLQYLNSYFPQWTVNGGVFPLQTALLHVAREHG